MTRQTFMSLAAGVSVVTGLAALLAPAQIAAVFGVTLDDAGIAQTRLLGAAYLGYAAIVWFAKDVRDHAARRAIALGNVVSYALSAVVTMARWSSDSREFSPGRSWFWKSSSRPHGGTSRSSIGPTSQW